MYWPSYNYNTRHRVGSALDAITGRVVWVDDDDDDKVVGVEALCLLLAKVRRCYGEERRIFLIWDNWHVHYQEKVGSHSNRDGDWVAVATHLCTMD